MSAENSKPPAPPSLPPSPVPPVPPPNLSVNPAASAAAFSSARARRLRSLRLLKKRLSRLWAQVAESADREKALAEKWDAEKKRGAALREKAAALAAALPSAADLSDPSALPAVPVTRYHAGQRARRERERLAKQPRDPLAD